MHCIVSIVSVQSNWLHSCKMYHVVVMILCKQVLEDLWASWLFRERWRSIFIPARTIVNPKKTVHSVEPFSRSIQVQDTDFLHFDVSIPFLDSEKSLSVLQTWNLNKTGAAEIDTFRRGFQQDWYLVQFENRGKVRRGGGSLKPDTSRYVQKVAYISRLEHLCAIFK